MTTVLLRLRGSLHHWGAGREPATSGGTCEPSKTDVLALLLRALGTPADDENTLHRLADLPLGVRVDNPGLPIVEPAESGGASRETGEVRDADYLVGLAVNEACLARRLDRALAAPARPLCLGREGLPAALPVGLGAVEARLTEVLEQWPWQPRRGGRPPATGLRMVLEVKNGDCPAEAEARQDVPLCLIPQPTFATRRVLVRWVPVPSGTAPR